MNIRVDVGDRTFLGLCACGARTLAFTHEGALAQLAIHERQAHPGEKHANEALRNWRKRHPDTRAIAS